MENFRSYPGKILLFGEYTILEGSKALAIPYDEYSGNFVEGYDARIDHTNRLKEIRDTLKGFVENGKKAEEISAEINNSKRMGMHFT